MPPHPGSERRFRTAAEEAFQEFRIPVVVARTR
jgi:hypothetical protein